VATNFYKTWLELKLVGDVMGTSSKVLVDCLFLEKHIVTCAGYLDTRIRRVLNKNPECIIRARIQIKHLYLQIHAISNEISRYFVL